MMVSTLAVLYYGTHTGSEARALTMAFSTFNSRLFSNRMLWMSLAGTMALQAFAEALDLYVLEERIVLPGT
jgi:Ca2+-transporting ATPase